MKWLVGIIVLSFGGAVERGFRNYEEGRFREAWTAFCEAETRAGEAATAELLFDRALAALGAGEFVDAECAAERAAARGGAPFAGYRDFILGNAAYARAGRSEAAADLPGSPAGMLEVALVQARAARDAWQLAAMSRGDWQEARRNVERALAKIAVIDARLKDAKSGAAPRPRPPRKDPREPTNPGPMETVEKRPGAAATAAELAPEQVRRLFEKLRQKEQEREKMRSEDRVAQHLRVERDW